MADYSLLDKILHYSTLSSKNISKTLFDLDKFLISEQVNIQQTVYVMGFARAGTTALTEGLYQTKEFASLTYSDMPFVMAPNLWRKISSLQRKEKEKKLRSHRDGVYINLNSPEALEEVFWQAFCKNDYVKDNHIKEHECPDEIIQKLIRYHRSICFKYNKNRYLSKNNNMLIRFKTIIKKIPSAKFLVLYRDPLNHSKSLLKQHRNFSNSNRFTRNYMNWLAHFEFGATHKPFRFKNSQEVVGNPTDLQYWVDRWVDAYEHILRTINSTDSKNIFLLSYDKLVRDDELWHLLTKSLDLKDVASPFKKLVPKNNLDRSVRLDKAIHVHKKLEEARKDLEINSGKS